jgi:hypothetical protein
MNASVTTVQEAPALESGSTTSGSAPTALVDALERLAHNAALEARFCREGFERADEAIAAVRRVSIGIAQACGLQIREDDRGDIWVLLDGTTVAFIGHAHEAPSPAQTR